MLGIVIGAIIISYAAIGWADDASVARNPTLGIILIILGSLFASLFYITEEIFLRKITAHGLLCVGIEGGWGILLYAILLPIFNHFDDPFSDVAG